MYGSGKMFTKGLLLKVIFGGLLVLTAATGVVYFGFIKPYAPINLTVSIPNVGGTELANCSPGIFFVDNSQNEDEFRIYRRNLGASAFALVQILPSSPGKGKQLNFGDWPLPLGTYEYQVSAFNKYGETFSDIKQGTVVYANACAKIPSIDPATRPLNPIIVSLSIINYCSVRINIRDNSTNEQGFEITRRDSNSNNTFLPKLGPHSGIPMIFDDKTKLPLGKYGYFVEAFNTIGSNVSNYAQIEVTSVCDPALHAKPTVNALIIPTAKKLSLEVTPEPTQKPTLGVCIWQAAVNVYLRKGPNVDLFEHLVDEKAGSILPIVGQSHDKYFWAVKSDTGEIGYVTKSKTFSLTSGDCSNVPTLKDPLPPVIKIAPPDKPNDKKPASPTTQPGVIPPTPCPVGAVCSYVQPN
jgi:hypothetical protein